MREASSHNETAPRTICLVRLSALGDVVMVLPLIKMLKREWPSAKITWLIGREAYPLVSYLERENIELISIPKPRSLGDYWRLRRNLRGRNFDALLCLQASLRANLIYPSIRARRKIGYGPDRAKDMHALFVREKVPPAPPHIVDGFFQFAEKLGGTIQPSDFEGSWALEVDPAAREWANRTLPSPSFAAISPCASKPERDWAPGKYAQAIEHLWQAHRMPAVLLGGKSGREKAVVASLRHCLSPDANAAVLDLVGSTSLAQLVAAIGKSAVLLAPDTGAVHIARALQRPVVGLYAVAPATRTGPYRETSFCIDKYDEAVKGLDPSKGDKIPWSHRVHDPLAMELITPSEVCLQLDRALTSNTRP